MSIRYSRHTEVSRRDAARLAMKERAYELLEENKDYFESRSAKNSDDKQASEYEIVDKVKEKMPDWCKNLSPFWVRLITGTIYLGLMIVCLFLGNVPTMIVLCIVSAISAGEFYYMLRRGSRLPNEFIGIVAAIVYIPVTNYFGLKGWAFVTLCLMGVLLVWYVFWMKAKISDVGVSLFGAVYTGGNLAGFMYLSAILPYPTSSFVLLIIFISVCSNDTFAYLIGSKFGKHKLAPRTSPKKSWEGFGAGILGCVIFWVLLHYVPGINLELWLCILFGIGSALFQVLGDLAESRIKRNSGFKDSGFILPGHGGLLDRCDSLFLASMSSLIFFVIAGVVPLV